MPRPASGAVSPRCVSGYDDRLIGLRNPNPESRVPTPEPRPSVGGPPVHHREKVAILVGGGPAPGINSVISAATIRCALEGVDVIGIRDGFEWLMQGDIEHVTPLTIDEVSRIHFRGGSHIGISRANPTKNPAHLENAVLALLRLDVSMLITIGGDDTAFSAMKLVEKADGRIRVVHVPKTIDNDLPLPGVCRHVRLPDGPAHRRRDREEPDGGRATTSNAGTSSSPWGGRPVTSRSGSASRPARRSRSSARSSPASPIRLKTHRRHAGRRDHQARELRPARRRGHHRRGPGAGARPGGPERARGRRARRPRQRAHRRGQHRRDPEGRGGEAAARSSA